jgi:hypothetical protein
LRALNVQSSRGSRVARIVRSCALQRETSTCRPTVSKLVASPRSVSVVAAATSQTAVRRTARSFDSGSSRPSAAFSTQPSPSDARTAPRSRRPSATGPDSTPVTLRSPSSKPYVPVA